MFTAGWRSIFRELRDSVLIFPSLVERLEIIQLFTLIYSLKAFFIYVLLRYCLKREVVLVLKLPLEKTIIEMRSSILEVRSRVGRSLTSKTAWYVTSFPSEFVLRRIYLVNTGHRTNDIWKRDKSGRKYQNTSISQIVKILRQT